MVARAAPACARAWPLLLLAAVWAACAGPEHRAEPAKRDAVAVEPVTEAPPPADTKTETRRPNIVIVMADDQGWGDVGSHGNPDLATPNLDALAAQGATFDRFFVSPVCSPTRAELLTGRYHPRSGVFATSRGGERMHSADRTLADVFKAAGYATGAFGKWHSGTQHPHHPNSRGFDEFYGFCSGHWGHYFDPLLDHNGELVRGKGYCSDDFTDATLAFIERHRGRPFLAYLAFNTPHSPMQVPDRWWDRYAQMQPSLPPPKPERFDLEHTRAALAMVENIDWNVGRLLARLDALDLADDTIVLYLSDNGPNGHRYNGGMRGIKGSTDEGGVRSPLFVRWPGHIAAGRVVRPISAAIDLLPTLAEAAGIDLRMPKPLDGISMLRALTDARAAQATDSDRMIFSHWGRRVSVRTQRHRLDHKGRLYDMWFDAAQTQDRAAQLPEVASRLQAAVDAWKRDVLSLCDRSQRPFAVGHRAHALTQLPARDGKPSGGVRRSNRFPNCTFFTRWTSTEGLVTWPVDVVDGGRFKVEILYACAAGDVGATLELRCGEHSVTTRVTRAHDPPLRGMDEDRSLRQEGYVKDFAAFELGVLELPAGPAELELRALEIPGKAAPEVRMLLLRRID